MPVGMASCPQRIARVRRRAQSRLQFAAKKPLRQEPRLIELNYGGGIAMIRRLKSGQFRLYSRKRDPSTGKRRNLGTFDSLEKAKLHEREVQYFKRR
jgi:hypothetical protein